MNDNIKKEIAFAKKLYTDLVENEFAYDPEDRLLNQILNSTSIKEIRGIIRYLKTLKLTALKEGIR